MPPVQKKRLGSFSDANVLYFLTAFRICNALLIRTFFQPDEYFQSLEPAWDIAFGPASGAWITWEWRERLRSSLHPFLFAAVYRLTALIADCINVEVATRSEMLLAGPKILQACFAALTDYFIWKLAAKTYGKHSQASSAALFLTVFSPWQWFCSTRTLSNSLETTLTTVALWLWPIRNDPKQPSSNAASIRMALGLAAIATVLRPTNAIIWIVMALYTAFPGTDINLTRACWILAIECREAVMSGVSVISISILSDRLYYGIWTFPPLRFVHFNVVQSLAVFYGRNRHDYYVTEGLPLLLTTTLPFAVWGAWNAFFEKLPRKIDKTQKVTRPLTLSVVVFVAIMSLIAHKEVRFIYPLLPALVVLAANPFSRFFFFPSTNTKAKKTLLIVFMAINMTLAFYTTQIHQRGVIDVLHHLRHQAAAIKTNTATTTTRTNPLDITNTTIIFLMPCHSTPWKSHLIGSNIDARALTCEPPLTIPLQNRSSYTDEADEFYNDPVQWMQQHMQETSTIATLGGKNNHSNAQRGGHVDANQAAAAAAAWPEYLVFFGQLEETIKGYLAETLYRPCWRGFNTHWHDDWRRQGDVVVWCLKGDE